jgi:hypothetical protein
MRFSDQTRDIRYQPVCSAIISTAGNHSVVLSREFTTRRITIVQENKRATSYDTLAVCYDNYKVHMTIMVQEAPRTHAQRLNDAVRPATRFTEQKPSDTFPVIAYIYMLTHSIHTVVRLRTIIKSCYNNITTWIML